MFEEIKNYLETLTPKQKKELIENLNTFTRLKTLLEFKGSLIKGKNPSEFLLVKDHELADEFLKTFKKMTLQGVKIIDKRKKTLIT